MNKEKFRMLFPLGSHLCREPMPKMSELKKDMENLGKHGFNHIKLQEHWAIDEPLEGRYDFSRYEELIAHAAKLDLGVYLGLTCEQAPGWLWEKYPDCRLVMRNGLPVAYQPQSTLPADGKPGPCFDHPGVRRDQARFIKKLVQVLGRHENIVLWNTWQEITTNVWSEGMSGGSSVCYCSHTQQFFRDWLKEKYGDLDGLNRAWNTRYLDWKYVVPDRTPMKWILPNSIDWNYFMENVAYARTLADRFRVIREADRLKRPVFAHRGAPQVGSGVDWVYARQQDFLGSSCYPGTGSGWVLLNKWDDDYAAIGLKTADREKALRLEIADSISLRFDYIRSCNRRGSPIWAAEFQGGPPISAFHKGRVPTPGDIRRWMLTSVGHGVTGISFWVTRAEIAGGEHNGYSLLDSEGDSTERYEEAARIGKALNQYPDLFGRPSDSGAKVAILINEWNFQACQLVPMAGEHLRYSVRGWHRLLWEMGIAVDFVNVTELDEDSVKRYRSLILPFPLSLSEDTAARLASYVENGGNLISEAGPGRLNEHGFCNRGELSPAARELFGVRQESLTMVKEPGSEARWSPQPRTWGEYLEPAMLAGCGPLKGHRLRANAYLETFRCLDSRPCLKYKGSTAATFRKAGQGTAWLLGTYAGHNGTAYQDKETRSLVRSLLSRSGIVPEHQGDLLMRKRISAGKEAWIFFNPTEKTVTERVAAGNWKGAVDLLGEKMEREDGLISLSVKGLDVRVIILTGSTS